jgi:hypothetical protein
MRRGRIGSALAVVVLAGVAATASGCGGAATLDPVAAAATKTQQAGAAHVAMSFLVQSPQLAGGNALRVTGSGVVDKSSADVTVDLGSVLGAVNAPASAPSSIHAIVLRQNGDELAFVHLTPMPSLTGGKGWVEVDLSKLASAHGLDLGGLAAGGAAMTPSQVLDLLRGAGATVTDLGSATVAGASTTHYRVLVDLAEVAKAAGIPQATIDTFANGRAATTKVPVNVWIGTDGLVHRVQVAYTLRHNGSSAHAAFTITLSAYGTNVSISPPPSSDVFDVTGFLTQLGAPSAQS